MDELRTLFLLLVFFTWVVNPVYAAIQRGRAFAIFSAVVMTISNTGALAVHARLPDWVSAAWLPVLEVGFVYGVAAAALHYAHLVRARLRPGLFRVLVSGPGQAFVASGFMSAFWLLGLVVLRAPLALFGFDEMLRWLAPLDLVPYAAGLVALFTSSRPRSEVVRFRLDGGSKGDFTRVPVERYRRRTPTPLASRPLRIVQIADPHIGPWLAPTQLRAIVDDLVGKQPDLVLLTGDFLTMESNASPQALAEALAPLERLSDRCFAIFGNHDHEAPEVVRAGLAANGIQLLVDDSVCADTEAGPVQIVGADYRRRDREEHLATLLARHPRIDHHLRLLLLHDPSAFHDLPDDDVDLVLSGHTHGGQVGLVSFGLDWTVLSRSRWPDQGLFARGRSHLYVHRGTGFYGFPLRVGVPGEASVLELSVGSHAWAPR